LDSGAELPPHECDGLAEVVFDELVFVSFGVDVDEEAIGPSVAREGLDTKSRGDTGVIGITAGGEGTTIFREG
jgi:hypothetical protein